ncbi:MAG: hypothetical protein LBL24_10675 [Bacteroidales bacterium]|jgi:predicted ATPase|nr:hypothetical protein [Bacteroidales bacterium]
MRKQENVIFAKSIKDMIGEISKSIQQQQFPLSQITVLIGENGCGMSNISEATGMASAAHDKSRELFCKSLEQFEL